MRKTENNWYVIWFVVGISLFTSGCPYKSGVEGEKWFQCSSKYDQALHKMWASGVTLKDYSKAYKAGQKYLQTRQPTEDEILSVLRSPDKRFQRVGLAAMSLKPIETDQLIDILFGFLQDQDKEFRWYARTSLVIFTKFPESRKAELGKQLLEIIKNKEESELTIEDFILLEKFPSKEAALFSMGKLMKEGNETHIRLLRFSAFRALKEMGGSYYDEAAEYVKNHGSPEIKDELLKQEDYWRTRKAPTGKRE